MADLPKRHRAQCMAFFGDDLTDEEVFETFGANDIAVRIGEGRPQRAITSAIRTGAGHARPSPRTTPEFQNQFREQFWFRSHSDP